VTSTDRQVLAACLFPDELLAICRANGDPAALDQVRAMILERQRGATGGRLSWHTQRNGIAWHTTSASGLLRWADVWQIATAGATPERIETLATAYRAYVDCPSPYGTPERWRLSDAIHHAHRTIILTPLVEQLDLFGAAA